MHDVRNHQDLDLWSEVLDLAEAIYRLSADFPADERFGLVTQMRRAAVSVPANIAEGAGRNGTKEFIAFLGIASGSLAEIDAHLILSERLEMASDDQVNSIRERVAAVRRMLAGLKRSLRARHKSK